MRHINEIIVHCTDTRPGWATKWSAQKQVEEVRRWHIEERSFEDIGYHFLISRKGVVVEGRPVEKVGAHVRGHNANSIGISLFGGYGSTADGAFEESFTPAQDAALRKLILELKGRFPEITKISGHNEYANKACPGFNVASWLSGQDTLVPVSNRRVNPVQSTTVQASAVQIASGAGAGIAALGALEGTAQVVALAVAGVVVVAAAWIMRERLRKWAKGDR